MKSVLIRVIRGPQLSQTAICAANLSCLFVLIRGNYILPQAKQSPAIAG